jgi:GTP-binding protein
MSVKTPSVVIVGRPNVGKSTLFNRLTGTRRSIVTDEPGITRDRIYGTANWEGRNFEVVDTGGIVPEDRAAIPRDILKQAQVAIESATVLVLVVDARTGLTPLDEELARLLRRTGKPIVMAANKVDSQNQVDITGPLHKLGAPVFPLSAEHAYGVDEMLDYFVEKIFPPRDPNAPPEDTEVIVVDPKVSDDTAAIRVAIIGRPNVGKSALLNQLAGEERSIVSPVAGTTRDSVDTLVNRGGALYEFVDTAGIRRKGKTKLVAEKLSVIMAVRSVERADVALLIVDSLEGVTGGDATIASYAEQSGCSVIIVMNKWDLALEAARKALEAEKQKGAQHRESPREKNKKGRSPSGSRREEDPRALALRSLKDPALLMVEYEKLVRDKLKFLSYAPVVFLSALTGERIPNLFPLIDRAAAARRRRISTGELNRWLASVDLERGTSPATRKVKIYYITQASSAPPTFVLFTNQPARLHFSYERFLENRLREAFDFTAAPLRFLQRLKERGHRERGKKPAKPRRTRA